ncbi:transposase [Escherichia coli]
MVATGGPEAAVTRSLQTPGFEVTVINPGQARDFARSVGYPAKTDSIDARVLAQMVEVMNRHPERERFIRPIQDTQRQVLTAIVVRRQLMAVYVAERNRLPPSHLQGRKSIRVLS